MIDLIVRFRGRRKGRYMQGRWERMGRMMVGVEVIEGIIRVMGLWRRGEWIKRMNWKD